MEIYDRQLKKVYTELEYRKGVLDYLYSNAFGRFLLKNFIVKPIISDMYSVYQKSVFSKKDIKPFIEKYGVNIPGVNIKNYKSFNDFFIRKLPVNVNSQKNILISPAESKLLVYDITDDLRIDVKHSNYSISEIVGDSWLAKQFKGGKCLVFRLGVNDYHRYIYIDNGELKDSVKINGVLHTVRSISSEYNVFSRNTRVVSVLDLNTLGRVVQIEVGALLVGKIQNNNKEYFIKGDEKGYFEFGGSTIIILLKDDSVIIDSDILEQSKLGIETKVSIGEQIGLVKEKYNG